MLKHALVHRLTSTGCTRVLSFFPQVATSVSFLASWRSSPPNVLSAPHFPLRLSFPPTHLLHVTLSSLLSFPPGPSRSPSPSEGSLWGFPCTVLPPGPSRSLTVVFGSLCGGSLSIPLDPSRSLSIPLDPSSVTQSGQSALPAVAVLRIRGGPSAQVRARGEVGWHTG